MVDETSYELKLNDSIPYFTFSLRKGQHHEEHVEEEKGEVPGPFSPSAS